ncbi:matrixin family metalloprotease [Lactobacillus sp. ESL0681]|uniref:matrixin family metalloprotease n=1 Tax=Lactobacillus sp. ESL0681 TaxID=2983211 RepID=UPI0023F825C3|nr:matrixin family metalloprotease [Lactobacillus sp. ESL0681]WEV39649.1 matrixin family metalloprotease [Lactobacillus sp. ESL0681]
MKKPLKFWRKFIYAIIAALTFTSTATALEPDNSQSSFPDEIVAAKKAKKSKKVKKKSKTKTTKNKSKNCHWKKPTATVYLDLNDDPELVDASNEAIKAWNDTNAFTFKKSKQKKSQITIEPMFDSETDAAGQTQVTYNPKNKLIAKAKIQLNTFYLYNLIYGYTHQRIVNTVEHELGHAIGLDHNQGKSVMYPSGSLYDIQPIDIKNVNKIYQKK